VVFVFVCELNREQKEGGIGDGFVAHVLPFTVCAVRECVRDDCECRLATVFYDAYLFNGDLSSWDVSRVTIAVDGK
jgi:surface protein